MCGRLFAGLLGGYGEGDFGVFAVRVGEAEGVGFAEFDAGDLEGEAGVEAGVAGLEIFIRRRLGRGFVGEGCVSGQGGGVGCAVCVRSGLWFERQGSVPGEVAAYQDQHAGTAGDWNDCGSDGC